MNNYPKIIGIGIDIIEVTRIASSCQKRVDRFEQRIYTQKERNYRLIKVYSKSEFTIFEKHLLALPKLVVAFIRCHHTRIGAQIACRLTMSDTRRFG